MSVKGYVLAFSDDKHDYFYYRELSLIKDCVVEYRKKELKDPINDNGLEVQSLSDFLKHVVDMPDLNLQLLSKYQVRIWEKQKKGTIELTFAERSISEKTWLPFRHKAPNSRLKEGLHYAKNK